MRGDLVVVPGLCVSSYLRPACDALASAGFDVRLAVPPSWPNGGTLVHEPSSLADLARPVADWLTADSLDDVVLVGQSVGAQLAAHVAVLVPDRVARLVLQGPVFDPGQRSTPGALWHWLGDLPREPPSLLASEAPEWVRAGPRRVRRTVRLALADRLEETLRATESVPVDVVVGEHDPLSTRAWTRGLVRAPGRHVVMPGLPHSSPHADPAGFADVVVGLVEGGPTGALEGSAGSRRLRGFQRAVRP